MEFDGGGKGGRGGMNLNVVDALLIPVVLPALPRERFLFSCDDVRRRRRVIRIGERKHRHLLRLMRSVCYKKTSSSQPSASFNVNEIQLVTGVPRAGAIASTLPHENRNDGNEGRHSHNDQDDHGWMGYSTIVDDIAVELVKLVVVARTVVRKQVRRIVV